MKIEVIGSNSLLFANLPPASQVPGRTYRVSNVGPAPGILLTSDGTKYRPAGGRQVLAMRNSPLTMQNTTQSLLDSVLFPGGLVRNGFSLAVTWKGSHGGLGAGARRIVKAVGNSLGAMHEFNTLHSVTSSANLFTDGYGTLTCVSDTSATHLGSSTGAAFGINQTARLSPPEVDFSLPWYYGILAQSAAETAVAISSATWAAGIATFNTAAGHTLAVGDKTVAAGVTPSGWNIPAGAIVLSVPTTTQFTVAMAADPGAYTSGGTSSRISNVISQSYVLELVG